MPTPLTRTQQNKLAKELESALASAGHDAKKLSDWDIDLEMDVAGLQVKVSAVDRDISMGEVTVPGHNFSGRGFIGRMVSWIMDRLPAPAPKKKQPKPTAPPKASHQVIRGDLPLMGPRLVAPPDLRRSAHIKRHPRIERDGKIFISK